MRRFLLYACAGLALAGAARPAGAETVALWLFDEQKGLYPGSILSDAGPLDCFLTLGRGGRVTDGKFGRALLPAEPDAVPFTARGPADQLRSLGLAPVTRPADRRVDPLTWQNASFCALLTAGERHLQRVEFPNPTRTRLNLGEFEWTVEFWFLPGPPTAEPGAVFEVGTGPRGENDRVTRLELDTDLGGFTLVNQPGGVRVRIPSSGAQGAGWRHLAFTYDPASGQLRHYVQGKLQPAPKPVRLKALAPGDEGYFAVGRDGLWRYPLAGSLDELRVSDHQVYRAPFAPPGTFSRLPPAGRAPVPRIAGPPPLFGAAPTPAAVLDLGLRKHLFLDDALIERSRDVTWTVNPPRRIEMTDAEITGPLSLVDDDTGLLRLYGTGPRDSLAAVVSLDGLHWTAPDLQRGDYGGQRNIVLREPVGLGTVFLDPNAPAPERWRYVSGRRGAGIYVYSSGDGWNFRRAETAALPFGAAAQSSLFYDDQRGLYVGLHRSDYGRTPRGSTQHSFALTETPRLTGAWEFTPTTPERTREAARRMRLKNDLLDPWWLNGGPLTPGGFGIEFSSALAPDDRLDPEGAHVSAAGAVKYPWAPDTYLAFPSLYFDYAEAGVEAREFLARKEQGRGAGVTEVQLAVSRDGRAWKRMPRPTYVGLGRHGDRTLRQTFMAQGMVRRGEEVWQYFLGSPAYHAAWNKPAEVPSRVYRAVQRLDGFVSLDAPYTGGEFTTRPLRFSGNQLLLNVETDATGSLQVAVLDADNKPLPGFSLDECAYVSDNGTAVEVRWIGKNSDLGTLAGRTVRLQVQLRGCKLYALQFARTQKPIPPVPGTARARGIPARRASLPPGDALRAPSQRMAGRRLTPRR